MPVFSLGTFADRWPVTLATGLLLVGVASVALQQFTLRQELDTAGKARLEAYARQTAGLLDALPQVSQPVPYERMPEMASADVGFRVLDGAGDVLLAGGSLADRNLRVWGEGADDVEGFVELVPGGSLATGLPGFQLKLRSGDRLLVSLDDAAQSGILRRMIFGTLATLGAAALFGVAVGRLVVRRDAARLREILDRTERLAVTRRLDHVPTSNAHDEIDRLGASFNAMMDRLGAGVERMQRFSANVAHELRAPMSRIRNRIEGRLERSEQLHASDRVVLTQTLEDVDRLNSTVRAMLKLAHSEVDFGSSSVEIVSLPAVLEGVIDFFSPIAEASEVELLFDSLELVEVVGDSNLLHELFGNLVDNAIKFSPAGKRVKIGVRCNEEGVAVSVADEGPGVAPYDRDRIFQAFQRLDKSVPGCGLGLSIAREIVHAHRGTVHVESEEGKGARFVVSFPEAPQPA